LIPPSAIFSYYSPKKKLHHAFVIDDDNKPIGLISLTDLMSLGSFDFKENDILTLKEALDYLGYTRAEKERTGKDKTCSMM